MSMTEQEKIEFEKEIRHKILMEQRERKAQWRASNPESIKRSNQKYYEKNRERLKAERREIYRKGKAALLEAKEVV